MAEEPDASRQQALVRLVRQDCGSCHGMTLQGGLGPPLLPASLQEKPAESLIATIYAGRPGTPMPPWKQFMSEAEATWIVDKLLTEFPK
jgi:cytochrome c55X